MAKQLGNEVRKVVARAISISRANAVAAAQPSEIDKEKAPRAMKPEASKANSEATAAAVTPQINAGKPRALPTGRWEHRASPTRKTPASALCCHLVVIEGGRQDEGGVRPVGRTRAGGTAQRVFLRVVDHAAPLSITD